MLCPGLRNFILYKTAIRSLRYKEITLYIHHTQTAYCQYYTAPVTELMMEKATRGITLHVMHITEAQPFCSQVLYFWGQIGWKCFFRVSHWQCVDQPLLKWHANESLVFSTRMQAKTILSGIISIVLNLRDEFLKYLVSLTTMKNCDIPFWAWSGQWKMIHFICLLPLMMFFAS